jgi:hypothetical protein
MGEIMWDSFKIAFNKMTIVTQTVITKLVYSFWCTHIRYRRDKGKHSKQCFWYQLDEEDWLQVLACPGSDAVFFRKGYSETQQSLTKGTSHLTHGIPSSMV